MTDPVETCRHCGERESEHSDMPEDHDFTPGPTYAALEAENARLKTLLASVLEDVRIGDGNMSGTTSRLAREIASGKRDGE